jgi:MSHA pilin protein MshD
MTTTLDNLAMSRARVRARRGAAGFTIVESVMSVLIVAGVLVASLGTVGAIGRARQVQVERAAAGHLATQVLAEVVQAAFQEPGASGTPAIGPDSGELSRGSFDDVDDYDGLDMSPPTLRDGTAMPDYAGWRVRVFVRAVDAVDSLVVTDSATTMKRVRVTVISPTGAKVNLDGIRSSSGAHEEPPAAAATYTTYVGVAARVGERGKAVYGGSHPLNAARNP